MLDTLLHRGDIEGFVSRAFWRDIASHRLNKTMKVSELRADNPEALETHDAAQEGVYVWGGLLAEVLVMLYAGRSINMSDRGIEHLCCIMNGDDDVLFYYHASRSELLIGVPVYTPTASVKDKSRVIALIEALWCLLLASYVRNEALLRRRAELRLPCLPDSVVGCNGESRASERVAGRRVAGERTVAIQS